MTLRIPGILILLTALTGAVSVAVAALPVVSRYAAADKVWTATTTPKPSAPNARLDLTPILDFAPFGRAVTTATPAASEPSALTLQGVSVSPDSRVSRAIIVGGIGDSTTYGIGDQVAGGATLAEIASDHVTLTTENGPQRLGFPGLATEASTEAVLPPTIVPQRQTPVSASGPVSLIMKSLRDQLKLNPQGLLDQYGIAPTSKGYLVGDEAFAEFGLQSGDLVTHINGQKVGNVLADRGFLDEVASEGQATVIVERAGQPVTLEITLP